MLGRAWYFGQAPSIILTDYLSPNMAGNSVNDVSLKYAVYSLGQVNFGHVPLNPQSFLVSDLSSRFRVYADKSLIELSSDMMTVIMGFPKPD